MEKYMTAAEWYLLGIGLYFVYNMFIHETPKSYIEEIHKEMSVPFSDAFLLAIIVVVVLLVSFIWPFSIFNDLRIALKGEHENDNSAAG